MKKRSLFLTFLFFTFLIGCGAQNNSAVTSNIPNLDTSDIQTSTSTTSVLTSSYVASRGTTVCGDIHAYSPDSFNISFRFNTSTGVRYNINVPNDDTRTQSLLRQMPPNVTARNVCAIALISGSTATITNITQ